VARAVRHANLEDFLCGVDRHKSIVPHGWAPPDER
jgi:hypothetical protein